MITALRPAALEPSYSSRCGEGPCSSCADLARPFLERYWRPLLGKERSGRSWAASAGAERPAQGPGCAAIGQGILAGLDFARP